MRFACWIAKATDTCSEYVIAYFNIPRQQWLRERASILRSYVYCMCYSSSVLVSFLIPFCLPCLHIRKERTKMGKVMPKEYFCNAKDTKLLRRGTSRLWPSGMWRRVVWYRGTKVLKETAVFNLRNRDTGRRFRQVAGTGPPNYTAPHTLRSSSWSLSHDACPPS